MNINVTSKLRNFENTSPAMIKSLHKEKSSNSNYGNQHLVDSGYKAASMAQQRFIQDHLDVVESTENDISSRHTYKDDKMDYATKQILNQIANQVE